MKHIDVAAGVVFDERGRVLICMRKGALDGLWEFPGGKCEPGETFQACLERELMEELDLPITAGEPMGEVIRHEDDREIRLVFLRALLNTHSPTLSLHVHGNAVWVLPSEIKNYPFCPADAAFIAQWLGNTI